MVREGSGQVPFLLAVKIAIIRIRRKAGDRYSSSLNRERDKRDVRERRDSRR